MNFTFKMTVLIKYPGVCRYADSKGVPQQFTCLQHLSPDDRTRYKALNIGEWCDFNRRILISH